MVSQGVPTPIVVNTAAGLGRRDPTDALRRELEAAGVSARLRPVGPARVVSALEQEIAAGARVVGVAGGDGTLLAAADCLAGSETILAPFPVGTLNHFARRLGSVNLAAATGALHAGRAMRVPVGVIDDRVFLNTAIFGFYADVVRRRDRFRSYAGKWGAAVAAFAVTLTRLRQLDVAMLVDGERLERRTSLVWVGVGRGSFPLVHESPDRRRRPDLEIVVLRPRGVMGSAALLLRTLLRLRTRRHPADDPALEVLHARQLLIQGRHHIGVTLDGEVLRLRPPIFIAVQQDALRVVVAEPATDTS